MLKPTVAVLLLLIQYEAGAQENILLFKKHNKTISTLRQGAVLAFMTSDNAWHKGEITRLTKDSVFITPRISIYNMFGNSTITFRTEGFAIADIYAFPNTGILIDYKDNRFQVSRTGGHVHWYWVKSGWLFRVGAAGYTGLNTFNAIRNDDFTFTKYKAPLMTAGLIFTAGVILHKMYKPYIRLKRKYHLQVVCLSQ